MELCKAFIVKFENWTKEKDHVKRNLIKLHTSDKKLDNICALCVCVCVSAWVIMFYNFTNHYDPSPPTQ